jgi:hypothetical protein
MASLPSFKPPDAYTYALTVDGRPPASGRSTPLLVVLCDDLFVPSCGSAALDVARARSASPVLVDRFDPAPGRHLMVFRLGER